MNMINLLPPKEKRKRRQEKSLKLCWIWGILLVASLGGFALILLAVSFYMQGQEEEHQALISMEEQKIARLQELEEKVEAVNESLDYLNNFYNARFSAVSLLENVSATAPQGVLLKSFSWQEESLRIAISGHASDSEKIYQLREALRGEDFENISFEVSDWLEEDRVNFRATFYLK